MLLALDVIPVSLVLFCEAHTAANTQHQDPSAQLEQLRRNSLLTLGELKLPEKTTIPDRQMPGEAQAAPADKPLLFDPSYGEKATSTTVKSPTKPTATFADTALVITESGNKHESPVHDPIDSIAPA